ncbi:MAG: LULAXC family (seleno)protein, partial [Desulfosudaceae bacterium]
MDKLFEIISHMAPEEALSEISRVLGRLLQDLDNDERERFLMSLIGQSEGD